MLLARRTMEDVLEILGTPLARVVLLMAVVVILLLIGFYVVRKFRDHISRDDAGTEELLSNFKEIHHRGTLSDEEYRTIKTALHEKLQRELKDKGETT
jgi:uncharacterized membrane protein